MSVLHAPGRPEVDRRLYWFPALILPLFLILACRLWYIQVVQAQDLQDQAARSRKVSVKKLAPRGAIFDRRGQLLAGVQPQYVVTVKPSEAKKNPQIVGILSGILGVPEDDVFDRVREEAWRNQPAPIKVGISVETATRIAEATDLPGVEVEEKPMRIYKDTTNFTHVLGYVWTPNDRIVNSLKEKDIEPAEYVGISGIERAYEGDLMGSPGVDTVEKRGASRLASKEAAVSGKQLHLTIDSDLQAYVNAVFRNKRFPGAVVAIEPKSGEILCLVSSPTFDSSVFEGGISKANWARLNDKENDMPMLNRATSSTFPPGSTYKIVTSVAAYRAGVLNRGTSAFCGGGFKFRGGGRQLACMGTHGGIGFNGAMSQSCNTFFCTMGTRAGTDMMMKTAFDMGLGNRTGIELLGEAKGIVPDEKWRNSFKEPRPWYVGNLANMSIGQGDINTSPLQMANVMAMVANNGVQYRPHLVRAKKDPLTGKVVYVEPEIVHKIEAADWFWDMLKDGLTSVISGGTAKSAQIAGVRWGGKTGSAEQGRKNSGRTHGWFVGFAPRENPKIAICVFGEAAGHGGDFAAPIAKEIVEHYLRRSAKIALNASSSTSRSRPASR
jgi:penicillin-binding protein 2